MHMPATPSVERARGWLIHEVFGVHVPRVGPVLEESGEGAAVPKKCAFPIVIVRMGERVLRILPSGHYMLCCSLKIVTHSL